MLLLCQDHYGIGYVFLFVCFCLCFVSLCVFVFVFRVLVPSVSVPNKWGLVTVRVRVSAQYSPTTHGVKHAYSTLAMLYVDTLFSAVAGQVRVLAIRDAPDYVLKLVGGFLILRLFNPCLVSPEACVLFEDVLVCRVWGLGCPPVLFWCRCWFRGCVCKSVVVFCGVTSRVCI